MSNKITLLKIKGIARPRIEGLDTDLMSRLQAPARVVQQALNGQLHYKAAKDGTYTVRVQDADALTVALAKTIITHNGFEVVGEVALDE